MKTLLLFLLLYVQSLFALVSIMPVEIGSKSGLNATGELALTTKKGNTEREDYKGALRVVYDNNISFVTWSEVSAEYGKSKNVEDTHKAYIHIRHIQAITPKTLRAEFFLQTQEDKFKLINSRRLAGAGLRIKLPKLSSNSHGYFGVGTFYEEIHYISSDPTEKNLRLNSYLAYTIELENGATLSYSFYFQPLYNNFHDSVSSHAFALQLNIYKELYLKFKVNYDLDTQAPMNVGKYDFVQNTSFVFNF